MHEPFQKFTYLVRRNGFFKYHKSHFTPWTDSAHHIQAESGACHFNNWGLAHRSPSSAGMKIGTNPAFILKIDFCTQFLCSLLYLWVYRLLPFIHHFRAFLVGAINWLLATQSQLPEQTSDRGLTEFDPEFSFYRYDNHRPGPKSKGKFHLEWVAIDNDFINPGNLRPGKLSWTAGSTAGFKRVPPSVSISCKPVVNTRTCKSEGFYDYFRTFTGLNTLDGTSTNFFKCLRAEFSTVMFFHEKT